MTGTPIPSLHGRHVLLVEDEYLVASFLTNVLEEHGAHVIGPAPTVDQALALVEDHARIDAAVLDVNLGGEPVFPVAEQLGAGRAVHVHLGV